MEFNTMSILTLLIGFFVGFLIVAIIYVIKNNQNESKANKLIEDAKKEADKHKRDSLMELKEESYRLKQETDKEIKEKKAEMKDTESRLMQREASLDKREEMLQKRDNTLDEKENNLLAKQKEIQEKELKMDELLKQELAELEKIAKFSKEKAHDLIMKRVEDDMAREIVDYIKEQERNAKLEAHEKAKQIIVSSMERYAEDVANEQTVSTIDLPNDEMKGRIIGREGRNIRTLETLTGVELIIDDTPEAVVLSGFDPVRREVARIALEKLILDGRIHPARIEEMVEKAQKEVETLIKEEGEAATLEVGVHGIHPELVRLLGKLRFRTSYGQNVLKHSIEVAQLTGLLAGELGLDVKMAKRAGLLHDIGKAVDHEMEGSHIQLGVDLCRRYKESALVINAVEAHHGDVEPESLIACLVQAADTISAARPGARRETLETYTNRLKQLEDITNSFKGVEKSFAIQAGREVRVMVVPEVVSDSDLVIMARDISKQIEDQMEYPGQIKVSIVRESRAVDYAK